MIDVLEIQHTGDQDLELAQQNIKRFVKVLEDNPVLDGRLIEDLEIAAPAAGVAGTLVVEHKLDRVPRGWIVTDMFGLGLLYRDAWDRDTITIRNGGLDPAEFEMWVF